MCTVKKCKGKLKDTIVNFGDMLHDTVLGGLPRAKAECSKADICLCLGSSLTVSPANSLPRKAKEIVICNPQATGLDSKASLRVWATSDMFFAYLMKALRDKGILFAQQGDSADTQI
jgi:NAD+-dependent protein deacetylase sirtuin 6